MSTQTETIPASWLQTKVENQRRALDTLHSAVVRQRFVLRTLEELGRGLSREEFLEAKERVSNDQVKDRIGEPDSA
jgi:hypothetical protein